MMLVPVNETWPTYPANQLTKHDVMAMITDEEVRVLYPLIFFYSTILIIGVIGNALVLLVYSFRYKHSPARVYILFLASIDFSICVFGLPYHMIDLTHPYTYTNSVACKTLTFVIVTLFFMSVFGLIVVASDRYLKICHPLSRMQIAYFGKKRACGTAVVFAFLFSWPNLILYGKSEMGMETNLANVTGYACYFETQYLETNYPFIYTVTILCICVGATVFLIIAYSCICHRIYIRYNGGKSNSMDDAGVTEEMSQSIIIPLKKVRPTHQHVSKFPPRNHLEHDLLQRNENHLNGNYKMMLCTKPTPKCDDPLAVNTHIKESAEIIRGHKKETNENHVPISIVSASDSSDDELEKKAKECKPHSNANTEARLRTQNAQICGGKRTGADHVDNLNVRIKCNSSEHLSGSTGNTPTTSSIQCSPQGSCNSLSRSTPYLPEQLSKQVYQKMLQKRISSPEKRLSLPNRDGFPMCKPQTLKKRSSEVSLSDRKRGRDRVRSLPSSAASSINNIPDGLRINSCTFKATKSSETDSKANKLRSRAHSKITKIMFTITVIFILSFTPVLVVTFWTVINPGLWDVLEPYETALLEFALRFYLVNNVCNPFIYGFWDRRFLREIVISLRKLYRSTLGRCLT